MKHNTINIFNEKWSPIKGYENLYLVSNYGRVLSLLRPAKKKNRNYGGRILRQHKTINGYPQVGLAKDNKSQTKLIHRLVCDAFKNNTYNKPCVNHIDLDKTNNHLSNLEWCTYSENEKHSYANGKIPIKSNLGNTGLKAKDSKQVMQYDLCMNIVSIYESASMAAKTNGIGQGHISACCRGDMKTYKKFIWKYISRDEYLEATKQLPYIN